MLIVQVGGRVRAMSDEPFALSTIPPALPAEADYDALRAAVMHSPRGRWFLEEYARRNRQTDTLAVLAAIERIETVIRGDRHQHAYQHVRADLLEMAKTIAQTRAEVATATAGSAQEQSARSDNAAGGGQSAPPDILATAERMQEVAWTMRERGIDPSTCVQIEALASSILSASSLRDPGGRRVQQLGEVLHYLERRIDTMLDNAAGTAAAAAAVPDEPAPQTDHDQPTAHFADNLDEQRSEIDYSQDESAEAAPASAVAGDVREQPSSHAVPAAEPQPSILAEAFGTTSLDALLAQEDDAHFHAAAPSEPALETAPIDIDPLVAAPMENPKTARTDSAGEEPLHAALEVEPLTAEPSFENGAAAAAAEPERPGEPSAPTSADHHAVLPAQPFAVPDVEYETAPAPLDEVSAEPALPPHVSRTVEPLTPVSPMPVEADASIPVAHDVEAESERHAAPELFFPAVSFDTAPAVEPAPRRQGLPVEAAGAPVISEVESSVVHQVQSDLDDLVAAPTEPEPLVAVTTDPSAIDLPAVDVSGAAFAPGVTAAEPPADTAPVEPAREVDMLSAAWESAVTFAPTATPSQAGPGVATDPMPSGQSVPSMWEPPRTAAAAASHLAEPEPADFLLEPLTLSPAHEPTAPASAPQPADPMREIEDELFATPPLPSPAATIAAPDLEPSLQQPIAPSSATPSAPAAPTTAATAIPGSAAATARLAARTMPRPAFNDPLAALNAMSDEERIALFT